MLKGTSFSSPPVGPEQRMTTKSAAASPLHGGERLEYGLGPVCRHTNEYLPGRQGFRQSPGMAKSKAVWKWRGQEFKTKQDLLAHLTQRARAAAQGVLGPPVDEISGEDRQAHSVKFKIQVSLGAWPPRNKKSPRPSDTSDTPGKRQRLRPLPKVPLKKGKDEYFG